MKTLLCFVILLTVYNALAANMCGTATADPTKNCISVRLPWQAEPIHFCIEKEKLKFRGECRESYQAHCDSKPSDLLVASPWECCPRVFSPDPCEHIKCPPAPFNRTCTEHKLNSIYSRYDCCPRHFCEKDTKPEQCQQKRMQPECTRPPANNTNCVAFRDPYGCCTKYQCNEGKAGLCPAEQRAKQLNSTNGGRSYYYLGRIYYYNMGGYDDSSYHMLSPLASDGASKAPNTTNERTNATTTLYQPNLYSGYPYLGRQSCIGDFTCPGAQKCCSTNVAVYSDGTYLPRNVNPTFGTCQDPVTG